VADLALFVSGADVNFEVLGIKSVDDLYRVMSTMTLYVEEVLSVARALESIKVWQIALVPGIALHLLEDFGSCQLCEMGH